MTKVYSHDILWMIPRSNGRTVRNVVTQNYCQSMHDRLFFCHELNSTRRSKVKGQLKGQLLLLLLWINILLTWFNNSACITIMVEGNFRLIVILITKKIIIIPVDLIWEYLIYYKSCSCSTWRLAMKGIVLISLTVFMQWRIFWSACANNAYFPKKTASSAGLKEDTCQVVV